jgi:DNA-directed RNA polymerase subunit RPC12/RpoP
MARAKRPPRLRTLERRARLLDEKLVRTRNQLLDLAPGGSEARPFDVPTAAVVEPKARAVRCPRCNELFFVEAHEAHTDEHGRLREAKLRCKSCGERRSLWFRIVAPS